MKKIFAWLARLFRWLFEKLDAGDCLLAIGLGALGYGVYVVSGIGWACIIIGAALIFFAYAGQATVLMCSMLGAARGQK